MLRSRTVVLAAALILAPLGAKAADLVLSWHKAHHAQEDEALAEVVAAFQQETGKQVEINLVPLAEQPPQIEAALKVGRPPDVAFGFWLDTYIPKWALEDRLVDLTNTVGSFSNMFDPAQLDRAMLLNAKTGQKALYGVPMGQISNYIHVWKSLLEQAGFSAEDIPKESQISRMSRMSGDAVARFC
jgi:multiple sugar transport system substrate-binding protein